ncbi:MAG TPA: DNA-3-methyladenine glycosylase 2 family protein [Candidatus Dormibacteraeota bacterium]|nr:DNA-3-methyladenine glycosylase 2 family protein [Candidatus Dormibacteraeota bacterium]
MEPEVSARIEPRRPLDLDRTLVAIGTGPSLRHEDGAIWRATRTPAGPATLRLRHETGFVDVQAWGSGAQWAVEQAPALIGEEDDDSGFKPVHPLIARLHREIRGIRVPKTGAVFEAIVPTVILQQVTTEEGRASYHELVKALGERAPGPVWLMLPPSPRVLANTPYWTFHRFGIERRRADVIIRAARSASRLEETTAMDMASAYRRMQAFPGVGPWTAAKVAMVALGDADAVPLGDYHLPHSIGFAFEGSPRSTDERMLELLEPYRGHRARVIRLITTAGIGAPRFGPKKPLRDIASL